MSLLRGLASGCWFDRLTSGSRFCLRVHTRVGVLGDTVVNEITPLQEVDGGELLCSLSFA